MRFRSWMTATLGAALAIGTLAGPAGARSDPPGFGEHGGDVGLHWILDNPGPLPELPAVTCVYGGTDLRLKLMRIRQPVLLANTADGHRRQQVGWKVVIEHSADGLDPWAPVVGSGWTKAMATAPYPADLAPKELALPTGPLEPGSYRVRYRLRWTNDDGSLDGAADHTVNWYRATSSLNPFTTDTGCSHTLVLLAGARSPAVEPIDGELAHSGLRGPHWILDNMGPDPEYPAVVCRYSGAGLLTGIAVRRPMVLARDRGAGVQAQDVAWRAVLEGSQTNSGTEAWGSVLARSPWTRARATELSWARLAPATFAYGQPKGIQIVRVVYQIRWYKGSTTQIIGRAAHTPQTYGVDLAAEPDSWSPGHCYAQAPGFPALR